MANMREIKLRMKSIKETRQITKAMKLISAAKLKKARQQLEHTLPYFEKVKTTIIDIIKHSGYLESKFFDIRHEKVSRKKAYFIITGDKSLAGGYNHNIIKFAEEHISEKADSVLFVAGQLGRNYFTRNKYNVDTAFDYGVQNPTVYRAREVAEQVIELFEKGEVDEVELIYTHMVSTLKLEPRSIKLLPLDPVAMEEDQKNNDEASHKIDEVLNYEPSPQEVFDLLIPKYVKGIVYGAFVEAFTSEQSARMTAMDSATSNADEMLHKLNLFYNRARQAAITQEISEIVGGATALQ